MLYEVITTNDEVTREQVAVAFYRYANFKNYDLTTEADLTAYTDASKVSSWANTAMVWATSNNLISGHTATTLEPSKTAIRAEIAVILKKFKEDITK